MGVTFAQFNNHEFLRHPGQQFRQDSNGLQFTQQISHSPNQQQQQQQGPQSNFGPAPQQQQSFQPQQQPSQQQIMSAIQQLTPQQIASFLRQHPAVAQQLAPQQQAQQQPRFQQQQPSPQPQFQQQQAPQFRQQPAPQPSQQQQQQQAQQQAQQRNQFSAQQSAPQQALGDPAKVQFSNVGQAPGGEYQFGFHTGAQPGAKDNSFREEVRLPDGTVKGAYGYVDANGRQRVVRYTAGKEGFQVEGDIHPDPAPAEDPQQSAPQRSAPQQQQQHQQQTQPRQSAPAPVFQQPPPQQVQFQPGNPGSALASFLNASPNQRNF